MQNQTKIKVIILLLIIMQFIQQVSAQEINKADTSQTEEPIPKIHVLAKVTDTEIVLRWAPDNPVAWHFANRYGYTIERYTLFRNGKQLIPSEKKILTPNGIKPAKEEQWAKAEKNKYNAVAWQAIFGEDFEISGVENNMLKIRDKSNVLTSRWSLALFACDRSVEAAELSALLFKDKNIKKNEKYLYRIYANIPAEIAKVDTGTYYVDAGKITQYPKPIEFSADFKDHIVNLRWNQMYYKGIYSSWSVERSDDSGKSFHRINKNPIVNLHNKGRLVNNMYYTDSIPENNKKYIYRIIGHSPFGDDGPPSDTVSGKGKLRLKAVPVFSDCMVNEKGEAVLSWIFPKDYNSKIKGFKIYSASSDKGKYQEINNDLIPPEQRFFIHKNPASVNYYKVTDVDKYGEIYRSESFLLQPADSIPPEAPSGLTGIIDSSGIVTIKWLQNKEKDLSGYRVYMTNDLNSEFTQITKKALTDTVFQFKTTLKTLTEDMFVKIKAEDNRFNPSDFSEIIKLKRPDTIAPSPPVIKDFRVTDSCIYLKWVRSTSKDVVNHIVFRSSGEEEKWEAIAVFDTVYNPDFYCDTSAVPGIMYKYIVIAVDDADNKSEKIKAVSLQMSKKHIVGEIKNFKAVVDTEAKCINLSWDLPSLPVKTIILYRKSDNEQLKTYKRFYSSVNKFSDTNLQLNTNYEYLLRIIYKNGKSSPFSKKQTVHY